MKNLIVWSKGGELKACRAESVPGSLHYDGEHYSAEDFCPGGVDYVRNRAGQLIGFAYVIDNGRSSLLKKLAEQSSNIRLSDGFLLVFLDESYVYEIQTVQAVGTTLYSNRSGNHILAVPDWGFGELAFALEETEVPLAAGSGRGVRH